VRGQSFGISGLCKRFKLEREKRTTSNPGPMFALEHGTLITAMSAVKSELCRNVQVRVVVSYPEVTRLSNFLKAETARVETKSTMVG
jgi:hypothetical protein